MGSGRSAIETVSRAQLAGNGAPVTDTPAETAATGDRTPFQLADIYRLRLVIQPAVSPDGSQIAFIMHGYRQRENKSYNTLWLAPSDGGAPARPLTRSDASDSAPAWSPDGRTLAYLSTRTTEPDLVGEDGKDEPKQQIWLLDLGGGEPRQLTNRAEGVNAFDWSPDGRQLVFEARDPSEAESRYLQSIRGKLEGAGEERGPYVITRPQHKWDGIGYLDNIRTHLFTLDVETGREQRLTGGSCNETEPRWSPTGEWIAFVSNRTGDADNNRRVDLWLVSADGERARRLTFGDVDATHPRWSPDGSDLVFTATAFAEDWVWGLAELYLIGLDQAQPVEHLDEYVGVGWSSIGGVVPAVLDGDPVRHARVFPIPQRETPRRSLTGVLDRPVEGPAIWLNQDEIAVLVGDRGRCKLVRASRNAAPEVIYPAGDERASLFGLDVAGGMAALAVNRPEGCDLASLPVADFANAAGALRELTHVNREIFAERQNVTFDTISFQNSEGQTIEGVVIQPPGFDPANGPLPLILYPHGGPMGYDIPCLQFFPNFYCGDAYLAGQGYLVLQVNYRGSTTYGQAFTHAIRGDLGPREYEDIRTGVDHLIDIGWADPERLFVTGVSYGGYLTAWSTGSTNRFRAAVPDLPAWDFGLSIGAGDLHLFSQVDYGLYWHNAAAFHQSSPSSLVLNTTTPSLITAGEHDWRCPPSQVEAYYIALKKIGVPTELIIYQDEHHAYTRPKRAIDRLIRIGKWFEQYGGLPFTDDSAEGYPSQS